MILDVGAGSRAAAPRAAAREPDPVQLPRAVRPGWLAGAHAVFRLQELHVRRRRSIPAAVRSGRARRIPVKGIVHVVDVSDIDQSAQGGVYEVPEGGAHNMWVEDDMMYMGYYSAGRASSTCRASCGAISTARAARSRAFGPATPRAFAPNLPFTWGAQPHKGLIYFNDINSGIWITKLGRRSRKAQRHPRETEFDEELKTIFHISFPISHLVDLSWKCNSGPKGLSVNNRTRQGWTSVAINKSAEGAAVVRQSTAGPSDLGSI